MSHRKVRSLGNVPFSWEEIPGVSKYSVQNKEKESNYGFPKETNQTSMIKYLSPPPPCITPRPPPRQAAGGLGRSPSFKMIIWGPAASTQDHDPFAKAIKKCTENNYRNNSSNGDQEGIMCLIRKKISMFSCKKSYDVEKGNLVKLRKQEERQQHANYRRRRQVTSCPRQKKTGGENRAEIGSDSHDPRELIKLYSPLYFNNLTLPDP